MPSVKCIQEKNCIFPSTENTESDLVIHFWYSIFFKYGVSHFHCLLDIYYKHNFVCYTKCDIVIMENTWPNMTLNVVYTI